MTKRLVFFTTKFCGPPLLLLALSLFLYQFYGHAWIETIYTGGSVSFLNQIISGQDVYPLNYYLTLADQLFDRCFWSLAFIIFFSYSIILLGKLRKEKALSGKRMVSITAAIYGFLFTPPIFSKLFAMSFLIPEAASGLWILASCFFLFALIFEFFKIKNKATVAAFFLSLLLLINIELTTRFIVNFFPQHRFGLALLGNRTYPELMVYQGHPFLQFTGAPSGSYWGNKFPNSYSRFNNYGFKGSDFHHLKPKNVIRIACLGGSTTQAGYPAMLEEWLNAHNKNENIRFEVLNFGLSAYTTYHSVVNFVLNVRDFSPDYVVIHHGWNDSPAHNPRNGNYRGDYSNTFGVYDPPKMWDRYIQRASVIYRYFQRMRGPRYDYILVKALKKKNSQRKAIRVDKTKLLLSSPFTRNLKTIIDLAHKDNIVPVLATMPHSTDPTIIGVEGVPNIKKSNKAIKKLQRKYGKRVLLVDLDKKMTGKKNELFKDLAHVHIKGDKFKAAEIGNVILASRRIP